LLLAYLHFPLSNGYLIVEVLDYSVLPCFVFINVRFPTQMEGVHKKGSKLNACKYRGISKLSAIPRLFENIITPHLQHSCRSPISSCQHGFINRWSTKTNLLQLTLFVISGFRKIVRQMWFTLISVRRLIL